MCLYEPINGEFPTNSFCNLHGPNSYNEEMEDEN